MATCVACIQIHKPKSACVWYVHTLGAFSIHHMVGFIMPNLWAIVKPGVSICGIGISNDSRSRKSPLSPPTLTHRVALCGPAIIVVWSMGVRIANDFKF